MLPNMAKRTRTWKRGKGVVFLNWQSTTAAAKVLGVSRYTVVNWIASGKIPKACAVKMGGRWKVDIDGIVNYFKRRA